MSWTSLRPEQPDPQPPWWLTASPDKRPASSTAIHTHTMTGEAASTAGEPGDAAASDTAWMDWPSSNPWTVVGALGIGSAAALCVAGVAIKRRRRVKLETAPTVLTMNLQVPMVAQATPRDKLAALFGRPPPLEFGDVLYALRKAGTDPAVRGVVARTGSGGSLSYAQTQELRGAIAGFRVRNGIIPGLPGPPCLLHVLRELCYVADFVRTRRPRLPISHSLQ